MGDIDAIRSRLRNGYRGPKLRWQLLQAKADVAALLREIDRLSLVRDGFIEYLSGRQRTPDREGSDGR